MADKYIGPKELGKCKHGRFYSYRWRGDSEENSEPEILSYECKKCFPEENALTVNPKFYGEDAKIVARRLGLTESGQTTHLHRRVWVQYKSVEGHPVVEMEFDL